MENGEYVPGSLWFYAPVRGAPSTFATLFWLSGAWHFYQCFKFGTWKVTGLYPWAALLFVAGFILREIGAVHFDNIGIFISSTVLIYAAPPVYELSNYLVLSRILYYIPYLSPMHPGRIFTTFAGLSAAIEAITANGAVKSANSQSTASDMDTGRALLKTALILQLAVMILFIFLTVRFHRNCVKSGVLDIAPELAAKRKLIFLLTTLYVSSALITTRTVYRTVEYFEVAAIKLPAPGVPFDPATISVAIQYEWFFWVFEATLMLVNSVLLNFRHPGMNLPRSNKIYLARDGMEREGVEFKDSRRIVAKILDPFDIVGLVLGRDEKWWEIEDQTVRLDIWRQVQGKK